MFLSSTVTRSQEADPQVAPSISTSSLDRLRKIIPITPQNPSPSTVQLIEAIGATKRLDACELLIKSLAFNFDPAQSNELLTQEDAIPAIGVLKRHYGVQVLPLLFVEGIATDQQWMRERCALAVRAIASAQQVATVRTSFSLASTQNKDAKSFDTLLTAPDLKVELYSQTEAETSAIGKAIESKLAPK